MSRRSVDKRSRGKSIAITCAGLLIAGLFLGGAWWRRQDVLAFAERVGELVLGAQWTAALGVIALLENYVAPPRLTTFVSEPRVSIGWLRIKYVFDFDRIRLKRRPVLEQILRTAICKHDEKVNLINSGIMIDVEIRSFTQVNERPHAFVIDSCPPSSEDAEGAGEPGR